MGSYRPSEVVGQRVREVRNAYGWSQHDLAERMTAAGCRTGRDGPITQLKVSRIERGIETVTIDEVFAFSVVLNVEPAWLLAPIGEDVLVDDPDTGSAMTVPTYVVWSWWRGELLRLTSAPEPAWAIRDAHQHPADLAAEAALPGVTGLRRLVAQAVYAWSRMPSADARSALENALGALEWSAASARNAYAQGGRRVEPHELVAAWWREDRKFQTDDRGQE